MNAETTDALASIPKWFKHLSSTMDEARVATLRACIEGLGGPESAVRDLSLLVRAAHRQTTLQDLEELDELLGGCAPTYIGDQNAEELQTICGAALVFAMSKVSMDANASATRRAVRAALLVESAEFGGREPILTELRVASRACLADSSRRARQRLSTDTAAKAVARLSKLPPEQEATPDPALMYKLIVQRDGAIATLASRLESLVAAFNGRLAVMDEEIDVLWWARSGVSRTTGERWDSMSDLNRAIVAGVEVAALVKQAPATLGTLAVLDSVVCPALDAAGQGVTTHEVFGLLDILGAVHELDVELVAADGDPFLPLASGLSQFHRYKGDATATAAAIQAEELVADAMRVNGRQIAEQLLRERAIEALS